VALKDEPRFLELVERARNVGFYDALRLIEQLSPEAPPIGSARAPARDVVRLRPSTALVFGASDIESIERRERDRRWLVTAHFLGLYGASSPLPGAYAEHIMHTQHEDSGKRVREFLDIVHDRILGLTYRAGRRYFVVAGMRGDQVLSNLLALAGAAPDQEGTALVKSPALSRLFAGRARSTRGLVALLEQRLHRKVDVTELERRRFAVDAEHRSRLPRKRSAQGAANVLGSSFLLGRHVFDRSGVTVRVTAESTADLAGFGPGGEHRAQVESAVAAFVRTPVSPALTVELPRAVAAPWVMGRGSLGRDTWIGTPDAGPVRSVTYALFRSAGSDRR